MGKPSGTRRKKRAPRRGVSWSVAAGAVVLVAIAASAAVATQEKGAVAKGAGNRAAQRADTVAAALQRVISTAGGWCVDSLEIDASGRRATVFAPCGQMVPLKETTAAGLRNATAPAADEEPSILAVLGAPWWVIALAALGALLGVLNLFLGLPHRTAGSPRGPVMGGPTRGGGSPAGAPILIAGQPRQQQQPPPPQQSPGRAAAPDPRGGELARDLETLVRRHDQLQQKVEALQQQLQQRPAAPGASPGGGPFTSTPPRGQPAASPAPYIPPSDLMTPPGGFPSAGEASGDFLGGALSADDDRVHLRQSSRPMLEIRWQPGASEAAVTVNPEFRFGDLNAALLAAAFDVDGAGGAGRYETIVPARVEWGPGATAGRVKARGRARAVGA